MERNENLERKIKHVSFIEKSIDFMDYLNREMYKIIIKNPLKKVVEYIKGC